MNTKIIILGLLLVVLCALGCTPPRPVGPEPLPPVINTSPPVEPIKPVVPPAPPAVNQSPQPILKNNVVDANSQFATDLYARYSAKDGNIFFSPYSISSALAMTYEGAKGATADEMQAVLHLPDDKNVIRSGFSLIDSELNKADKLYSLSVANALWGQNDYPFVPEYISIVEQNYGGKLTNLDFKTDTENSRVTINRWVEDKTNDRIKDLISKGVIDVMTRLVLTNAIYFKANWSSQFEEYLTRDGEFTLGSGSKTTAKMMHQTAYYNYGETDSLQMLEMPYRGNDLSMLIILPKANSFEKIMLNKDNLNIWKSSMKSERVQVSMPKFKFETKYMMAEDLAAMGMPTAFRPGVADFAGMSPTGELFISRVIHQTFIEVAEYGTEAAAATAVVVGATGMPPQEQPKEFNADHPFLFIIQQKASGNILFMGRLNDPGK